VQAEVQAWLKEAEDLRGELMDLAQADARVFDDVMAAFRLPKETDEQKSIRNTTVQAALREATRVPLETVLACAGVVHLVTQVVDKINPAALSDAGTAAMLAQAGQRGACLNVKTNLAGIRDDQFVDQTWSRVEREAAETDRAAREIFSLCLSRMD
jgi:formiminotetrahydrofolate cyclodeaminase